MYIKQSYDDDFQHLMLDMKDKYPKSIFELNGISDEDLDRTKFAKKYFTKKNVANISVDSNANVQIKNIAAFNGERNKGLDKLDSLFLFWKTAKKLYGLREANKLVEKELNKDLNIQDSSNFYLPYSYYGQTPILLKINGQIKYWTLKQLYENFSSFSSYNKEYNMYKIKTDNLYSIYDYEGSFMTEKGRDRFTGNKQNLCPYKGDVKEKIDIKIWDKDKWINLKQIIKHKHEEDKEFIIYQTNNGDFAFITEDHPVILSDNSEKLAKDLFEGDEIIQNNILPDYIPLIEVPDDVAYITGFILGDGNGNVNGNVNGYSHNWDYIKKNKLGVISPNIRLCRNGNNITIYQKDISNSFIKKKIDQTFPNVKYYTLGSDADRLLNFTSQSYSLLYGDYFNCGVRSNSFSKRLPENILNWKEDSFISLLGGLIDSDGTINGGRIEISLCSYAIINELSDLLKIHGFKNVIKRLRLENNKLGNNFLFSVAFRVDERLVDKSEKVKNVDISFFKFNPKMDSKIRDNKISKIFKFKKSDISKTSFLYNEIQDVYDVTTETGTFYANGMLQHNCFAFDTYDLLTTGLPFVTNYPSETAKHSDVFWQHTLQLLQYAAPQMMGATAIPNFVVIYSSLLKYDSEDKDYPIPSYKDNKKLFERYVKQRFQEMIFALNQPLRQVQSTFTNITIFDSIFMKEICSKYVVKDKLIDHEFAMYIQKLFLDTVNELNEKRIATFPILTAQLKKDENFEIEDKEFLDVVSKINLPTGHLNIFSDTSLNALSSCCRLVNGIEDLIKATKDEYMNLIGGSSIKVGSFGVVTLPLVRVALKSKKNKEEFFKILEENAEDAYRINNCRRTLIAEKIEQGEMPLYSYGFINLDNQYSTLGINGFYECLQYMGYDITTEEGINFGIKILQKLQEVTDSKMKKYGYRTNIEQIPAEQTSSKLAKADSILYNQNDYTIYGNQFIPLTINGSIYQRIDIQAKLEKYFSGGTILHCNFSEKIPTTKIMKKCIEYVVKSGVKYFAINYFFNICKNTHYTVNNKETCEICGEDIIDKMTRIVGFFVPLSSWSKSRVDEFNDRKKYDITAITS